MVDDSDQWTTESDVESLSDDERIRRRAYEIYVERGLASGYDLEDWLAAEREISDMGGEALTDD